MDLEVIKRSGTPKERWLAEKIEPVRAGRRGHERASGSSCSLACWSGACLAGGGRGGDTLGVWRSPACLDARLQHSLSLRRRLSPLLSLPRPPAPAQILAHPHRLLATLLLGNALAMEALPLFLDRLLNPWAAILISVTAILIFGEIIPQAVCKRYGLQVGAYLSWLVRTLMVVTWPITWPIAKLLDYLLGEESALFR